MKTNIHLLAYLTHLALEWEMFQTKVVEKIKTFCVQNFNKIWYFVFFPKSFEKIEFLLKSDKTICTVQ